MLDISQIQQRLGSFSEKSDKIHHLTQAYALTWSDIYNIINGTLMEDEKNMEGSRRTC
jgi:Mor family transcriptional regulator